MVSTRRLISIGFALVLSIGIGLQAISATIRQSTGSGNIPVLIGIVGAFVSAYLLLQLYPDIESSQVWWFGGLTFVLFVVGNAVVDNGIYAPSGQSSTLVVGLLWIASLVVAYGVMAVKTRRIQTQKMK